MTPMLLMAPAWCRRWLLLLIVGSLALTLPVKSQRHTSLPADLVTAVTANELAKSAQQPRLRYFERRRTDEGHTATYEIVETDAGSVEWRVAVDGKPLDAGQKRAEEQWLDKLIANPEMQLERKREEEREAERRKRLMNVLPQAFLYEQQGTEQNGRIVRLHFRPNPSFRPQSREAQVFRGMEGTLWLDSQALRFTKAEGTLIDDVSFGWGILGRLHEGGKFSLNESEVIPEIWRITELNLSFDGKILLFKSIHFRVQNLAHGHSRVPDHLSLEEGVRLLRSGQMP